MSTIITTGLKRRVEADPSGMTVTDTTDGRSIIVALTRAQASELAVALNPERDFSGVDWKAMYDQARSERDTAVYAYDKAERERDAAVARAEKAESERDHGLMEISEFREELAAAYARAEKAERERDEWKARAEAAEARTAPAVPLHQPDGTRMDASHLPIGSDDDPVVYAVRESDLPEVQRREDGSWAATPGLHHYGRLAEPAALRRNVKNWMEDVAQAEAVARAIEAEQATDPAEELAGQIASDHALAEAVLWLYTPDGPPDGHDVHARSGTVWLDGIDHTPDEAADLARALLAAVVEARS